MLKIVKIGGNIVDNPVKLQTFLAGFAALDGDKILVHGGGKVATAISAALGIETVMIEGRRVTDAHTLEIVTMVYNGINKQIVSVLQGLGCNAVGLCGADGRLVVSRRRCPVAVGGRTVDYGFVGDPVEVNTTFIQQLIKQRYTLVVAPLTCDVSGEAGSRVNNGEACGASDGAGGLLNTNADTVAQTITVAMAGIKEETGTKANTDMFENTRRPVELIYCFEKQGVLADINNESSVIPHIDRAQFDELKAAGAIHSGMLPKLENAFHALDAGVQKVVICAAENIAKPDYGGTTIVK